MTRIGNEVRMVLVVMPPPMQAPARAGWRTVCTVGAEAQKMASVASLREHLVEELNDLLNAEQQLIEALPQMADRASTRELKAAFKSHLAETRQHEKRVS